MTPSFRFLLQPFALTFALLTAAAAAEAALLGVLVVREDRHLWYAVAGILAFMGFVALGSWGWVLLPMQRRLTNSREQFRLLFEDNPEPVFTYDIAGTLLRANPAALRLLKTPKPLPGGNFLTAVPAAETERAKRAFAQALAGEYVEISGTINQLDGGSVDVTATLVPHVVDGRIAGVYAIARDLSAVRRSERLVVEQSERIRDLYLVAASPFGSPAEQIARAIELGCKRLHYPAGFIARLEGDAAVVESFDGFGDVDPELFAPGDTVSLGAQTLANWRHLDDVSVFEASRMPNWASDKRGRLATFSSFAIAPVAVNGEIYGAIGFAATAPHEPLSAADRDFIRLIGALAAVAIERSHSQRELSALAFYDPLTGLPNRAMLESRFAEMAAAADASGESFALHFVDLDGFKEINDVFGHNVGDAMLRIVAKALRNAVGPADTVARFGGDEFVVLQARPTAQRDAGSFAQTMLEFVADPIVVAGTTREIGASVGIATYLADGSDLQTLLGAADAALYRAKAAGRGVIAFATPQGKSA